MLLMNLKSKKQLKKVSKKQRLEDKIGQILIPTQKTFHIRDGKKVEREKKLFNSYIIIEAELTPEVYSFILNIPWCNSFSGLEKNLSLYLKTK